MHFKKFITLLLSAGIMYASEQKIYECTFIGAGPSGIIGIGVMLDAGVDANDILWIDDAFNVGRMGKWYQEVPANNTAKKFIEFITACRSFTEVKSPAIERLQTLNPDKEYKLQFIVEPLHDITNHFLQRIDSIRGMAEELSLQNDRWNIRVGNNWYASKRVVLAIGCHPRSLGYDCPYEVPLDSALTKNSLQQYVQPSDTVAVVGDAHSAVLIIKFLYELGTARIINFYRHPLHYLAKNYLAKNCELQNEYLGGVAAEWAREVLDKNTPSNIIRLKTTPESLIAWLPLCTKIIYAAGFERNPMPIITGITMKDYDPTTGIIGPRLFGIGIAFPELAYLDDRRCRYEIGLEKFINFAQRIVPEWLHKSLPAHQERANYYDDIFHISYISTYADCGTS